MVLQAIGVSGRKILYKRPVLERFGSCYGFGDREDRNKAAISGLLCAEKVVQDLRIQVPDVTVNLIGPEGHPMNDEMLLRLNQDADKYGVSIT